MPMQSMTRKRINNKSLRAEVHARLSARACLAAALVLGAPVMAQASDSDPGPWFTSEQAERGERVFMTTCAGCHGFEMIENFTEYENADLYHSKISLTMPWENEGGLPAQNYIDIVAFMLRENGFPAGESELEIDRAILATIIPANLSAE